MSASFPTQVAKIIPRLATDHVGELVAARDAISRALRAAGLDWHDVARACSASDGQVVASHKPLDFGDLARACRDLDCGRLSQREREFVASMCRLGFTTRASQRQADWLAAIFARLQGRAAA